MASELETVDVKDIAVGLTPDEKLHIRTLELEVYKIQAQYKDVESSFRGAVDALNGAIKQAGEKLGYDLKEYRIDLKTLEFVRVNADTK